MARQAADYPIRTKTARLKLAPRPKPYYRQIAPGVTLGYMRRDSGPGAWQVRELVDGTYRYRTLGVADDVARADGRDVLTFEQAQAAATKPAPTAITSSGKLTVRAAMEAYLSNLAARSAHAKEARQRVAKHILPILGAIRVDRVTKAQIEAWRTGLVATDGDDEARRRSQDSANRVLTILKAALNAAFEDESNGIATDSAWRRVKAFRGAAAARVDHFDAAQVRLLIAKAATFDHAFAALLEVGYLTGARLGELTSATVGAFDRQRATLTVTGKTGSRVVTLSQEAVAALIGIAAKRPASALLLPRADGAPWGKSEQARPFKRAAAMAGLPPSASFYSLRHSHISRAIEAGVPLSLIAENCGTSLMMIQRNYAHVLAETKRDAWQAGAPKLRRVK